MTNGWHRRNPDSPAAKARKKQYDSTEHRRAKAHYTREIAAGRGECWRGDGPIPPGSRAGRDWHVGHDDHDRSIIRGAEHARCNLRAAARAGNAITNRTATIRRRTQPW